MFLWAKPLTGVTEQDLQRLIVDQVQERDTLEYKSAMYGNSDDDKREMLKDVTSLANHRGGYIIIGAEANEEGIPTSIPGLEPNNYVERITNSCNDNIDKRIVGLQVEDIHLQNGRVIVVISIPESQTSPHIVTFKGLNQFWKRYGRQKEKMTTDEIGEAFNKRLANLSRVERYSFTRKSEVLESIGDKTYMVISSLPIYVDETVFDVNDKTLRETILNPPSIPSIFGSISCGVPYITLNGLRADQSTPYDTQFQGGDYLEVFRNGYIEYANLMGVPGKELCFPSGAGAAYIVNFVLLIDKLYSVNLPLTPLIVNFAVYNAKGMWLAVKQLFPEDAKLVKWPKQHLELETFYIENIAGESKLLAKKMNDRIWQAFHRERATIFDGEGKLKFG